MNVLMISAKFPYPATRGGTEIRTFYCLEALKAEHSVTLLTFREDYVSDEDIEALRGHVDELVMFDAPKNAAPGLIAKLNRVAGFVTTGTPPNIHYYYSPEVQTWVDDAIARDRFDAITCEHSVNALYIRPEWKEKVRTVINVHSSDYCTKRSNLDLGITKNALRDRLTLPLLRRYEADTYRKFTTVAVTTEDDETQIQEMVPELNSMIIPNGVELDEFTFRNLEPAGRQLIFTGTFDYSVNIDTALYLAQEIFPRVQAQYPDATLAIVGNRPDPCIQALAEHPGVIVTGRVPSLADALHESALFVAPMRAGYGIKNKTLEAMAAGVPIVGSDRALEGLQIEPSDGGAGKLPTPLRALRANTTDEYVEAIARLFEDPSLRQTLARNSRTYIEESFTWTKLGEQYRQAVAG